jgi:hypothetical protein
MVGASCFTLALANGLFRGHGRVNGLIHNGMPNSPGFEGYKNDGVPAFMKLKQRDMRQAPTSAALRTHTGGQ